MNSSYSLSIKKIDNLDKFLIICISLIPLSLAISIFFADLLASISGLILIYLFLFIFFKKKLFYIQSFKN